MKNLINLETFKSEYEIRKNDTYIVPRRQGTFKLADIDVFNNSVILEVTKGDGDTLGPRAYIPFNDFIMDYWNIH